jgi:hypothetical protein
MHPSPDECDRLFASVSARTTDEDMSGHLSAFAQAFIVPARRPRWSPQRLSKPATSRAQLPKFYLHCDQRYCRVIEKDNAALQIRLANLDESNGLYFDENASFAVIPLGCALVKAMYDFTEVVQQCFCRMGLRLAR